MKVKMHLKIGILIFSILLINSCGEVKKEIAKDQLSGNYSGKATYNYLFSSLVTGASDEQATTECSGSISKTDYGTYINIPDGRLSLSNVKLLGNGVTFNIMEQTITSTDNYKANIIGNTVFIDSEGNKTDGQYNSDTKTLEFSFTGRIKMEYSGIMYEVPFEAYLKMSKN